MGTEAGLTSWLTEESCSEHGLQISAGHLDFIAEPIHLLDHIDLMNRLVGAAGPYSGLSVFEESSMLF